MRVFVRIEKANKPRTANCSHFHFNSRSVGEKKEKENFFQKNVFEIRIEKKVFELNEKYQKVRCRVELALIDVDLLTLHKITTKRIYGMCKPKD